MQQMYGKFEGFLWKIVHCLGWCHIMTPVVYSDPKWYIKYSPSVFFQCSLISG